MSSGIDAAIRDFSQRQPAHINQLRVDPLRWKHVARPLG
jgi:hypothetical protein